MKRNLKNVKGQAVVEYIIIVVIVAVAALAVLGIFSDTVRGKIAGVASVFGADNAADSVSQSSTDILKKLDKDGAGIEALNNQ